MTLQLVDDEKTIQKNITGEIFRVINTHLNSIENQLKSDIRDLLIKFIEKQDPYPSLKFGTLRAHFGLPAGSASEMVDEIVNVAVSDVSISNNLKVGVNRINGSLEIKAINDSYARLLGLRSANVTTEKGVNLPWLNWLLTYGGRGIVTGFDVKRGRGIGRSGLAIMEITPDKIWSVPDKSDRPGGGVSQKLQGIRGDNWFTRAIKQMMESGEFEKLLRMRIRK